MNEKYFIKQLNRLGIDLDQCSTDDAIKIVDTKIKEARQEIVKANKILIEIYKEELRKKIE